MIKLPTPESTPAFLSVLQEAAANLEKAKKRLQEELQASLHEALKTFFEIHPEAAQIRWTQYTPYFNDGEPCEFRVNEPQLLLPRHVQEIEDGERWVEGYDAWALRSRLNKGKDPADDEDAGVMTKKLAGDFLIIADVLQSDDDVMRAIFGDHVEIIATKDGITVNDYDHD